MCSSSKKAPGAGKLVYIPEICEMSKRSERQEPLSTVAGKADSVSDRAVMSAGASFLVSERPWFWRGGDPLMLSSQQR